MNKGTQVLMKEIVHYSVCDFQKLLSYNIAMSQRICKTQRPGRAIIRLNVCDMNIINLHLTFKFVDGKLTKFKLILFNLDQ